MITVCCVCHKYKNKNRWVKGPAPKGELLTHGFCPRCAEATRKEIYRLSKTEAKITPTS